MDIEAAFGPHDVISQRHFFLARHLRGNALRGLLIRPPTLMQAFTLSHPVTSDADRGIEVRRGIGFKQKRDHSHGHRLSLVTPGFQSRLPDSADAGMENGFKVVARTGVGENTASQFTPAQTSARVNDVFAEVLLNLHECRLAGFDNLARNFIGIDNRDAAFSEQVSRSRFTHPDAAGQSEGFHTT